MNNYKNSIISAFIASFLSISNAGAFEVTRAELLQYFREAVKSEAKLNIQNITGTWHKTNRDDTIYPQNCDARDLDYKEQVTLKKHDFDNGTFKLKVSRTNKEISITSPMFLPASAEGKISVVGKTIKYMHLSMFGSQGTFSSDGKQYVHCTLLDSRFTDLEALVCFKSLYNEESLESACGHFDFYVR